MSRLGRCLAPSSPGARRLRAQRPERAPRAGARRSVASPQVREKVSERASERTEGPVREAGSGGKGAVRARQTGVAAAAAAAAATLAFSVAGF